MVKSINLIRFISSIHFYEIEQNLFEHLQYGFFSNSLLPNESETDFTENQMLLFSENTENHFEESKKYQEIKSLFEFYPKLFPNILEIESKSQTELDFTGEQKEFIKQFKNIEVMVGKADNFGQKYGYCKKIIFVYSFQFLFQHSVKDVFEIVLLFLRLLFQTQSHHLKVGALVVALLFLELIFQI
jgi:hypothetical protein